ncbi:MAG: hypothetical protein NPINA01_09560 [Nitrospinaceae bacterium]|nr:MAG: hypothetical protein NPINA01_09560 [Nitrospinaceae bacterium]
MKTSSVKRKVAQVLFLMFIFSVVGLPAFADEDPPEIVLGERLFLETRFAQFFFANSTGPNTLLISGDPILDEADDPLGILPPNSPGPFAGFSMNCRACHFVDGLLDGDVEAGPFPASGMRTYTDFSRRSRVPAREDGLLTAPRNSPPLVGSSLFSLNHFDAEFATMADLVKATLTGRNYGWLPTEAAPAIAHVASIIRADDGSNPFAGGDFVGEPYTTALGNPALGALGLDVTTATDEEIFDAVANLIAAYVDDLGFSQDDDGNFNLSPYDAFLAKNGLDRQPAPGESFLEYSRRLLKEIYALGTPLFVAGGEPGPFKFHDQSFSFGPEELAGLKIFFAEPARRSSDGDDDDVNDDDPDEDYDEGEEEDEDSDDRKSVKGMETGNCVVCHRAPNFTDLNFHNTGAAQDEYDAIHGKGKFRKLKIPSLFKRLVRHNRYLPATSQHPTASGRFRSVPSDSDRRLTDLGLWNIFANPDFPKPQAEIWETLCEKRVGERFTAFDLIQDPQLAEKVFERCRLRQLLPTSIALFKTPGLRDLGHSAPFMHTGQFDTLDSTIEFYRKSSILARAGKLRNGASQLKGIRLSDSAVTPLVKFLKALNEDYE